MPKNSEVGKAYDSIAQRYDDLYSTSVNKQEDLLVMGSAR